MKNSLVLIALISFLLNAETLFEVKDASNNKVLDISTDGLRVMNQGDTLMVISSNEIKANISSSKGLSRTFSVTTNSAKGSGIDLMRLTSDSTRFWISDSGSGFGVSSQTAGKDKSVATNFLKVSNENTQMREGGSGDSYTDFSPENIFLGLNSGLNTLPSGSDGVNNTFFGNESGITNSSGSENVFIGPESGYSNTDGTSNVFMGYQSGRGNTGGDYNIFIGDGAGLSNSSGNQNVFIGKSAGKVNTGSLNLFIGTSAGFDNTTGGANMFIGNQAGSNNTTGLSNTFLGWYSGASNVGGNENLMIGTFTGSMNTSGDYNTYIGDFAGAYNSGGSSNVCLGNRVTVSGSNKLAIDNSDTTLPLIYGEFDNNYLKINGWLALSAGTSVSELSTDGTLGSNSDNALPTEKAVKTYVGNYVSANGDNLGNHTATANIRLNGKYLSNDGGNEGIYVDTGGDVGIGTSSPGSHRLFVTGSATAVDGVTGYFENTSTSNGIALQAKNTSSTNTALALLAATAGTGDIVRFDSWHGNNTWDAEFKFDNDGDGYCDRAWHGGGTDYAEYFPKANTGMNYEPGDIIMLSPDKTYTVDGANINNRNLLLGVFSDNPAVVGNSPAEDISHDNDVLVGLLGVLKTKVNTENGDIKIGDFITVSSSSKIGMKATNTGMVIGRAMDNYNEVGTGMINVFVDAEWYYCFEEGEISSSNMKDTIKEQQGEINELKQQIEELREMIKR